MTIQQLKKVYEASPFRPFSLHMAHGRKLYVPHHDFLSHSPTGRTVIVYGEDDDFNILDVLMITEIEVTTTNGSRSRRKAS